MFSSLRNYFTLSSALMLSCLAAQAQPAPPPPRATPAQIDVVIPSNVTVSVDVPPQVGRSRTEYFYSPILGISYTDITQLSSSVFVPDTKNFPNSGNSVNITNTTLGATLGFLVDGQFQVVATDYWRIGYQTGLVYHTKSDSSFKAEVCNGYYCNGKTLYNQKGTFSTSNLELPMLFTYSRYASNDQYIVTFKIGPMISYEWYQLDFDGFLTTPSHEFQAGIGIGLDGRYRIGKSKDFFLFGFDTGSPFGGGGGNAFSGVNVLNEFSVYVGISFT